MFVDNEIVNYMERLLKAKESNNPEDLMALEAEGATKSVTLRDVGFALDNIINDLLDYTEVLHELNEKRLRAIIKNLDATAKINILQEFIEAEDDLFENEGDGEENGKQEHNQSNK